MRDTPRSKARWGSATAACYLVESVADVERLAVADPRRLAYVTQTTLSVDDAPRIVAALKRRFPRIVGPKKDDICYATQNRQDAVKFLAPRGRRRDRRRQPEQLQLEPAARSRGEPRRGRLHGRPRRRARPEWIAGKRRVGVTAGASAPEVLVREVIDRLRGLGAQSVRELDGVVERVVFPMPKGLATGNKAPETGVAR